MPVDFFSAHHTQSNQQEFGLCDDPAPAKNPSYILEADKSKWIGIVKNPGRRSADFYGLDHAIRIPLPPPNDQYIESLCDGLLVHDNQLSFVELKERISNTKWIGKSTDQIINSIRLFADNHNLHDYDKITARICNKLKPQLNRNCANSLQKFRDEMRRYNHHPEEPKELIVQQDIHI
ncbi:hypothetical protein [Chitinophaga sp.]|uniref:hypothetical protein n=1 Tax=Chitinophaga sp. TaxID=1869181 RepID=UPI0031DDFBDC